MDMPLIIKQVCQQPSLMEVMQRGSGPERGPLGAEDRRGWWAWTRGWGDVRCKSFGSRYGTAVKAILRIVNVEKPAEAWAVRGGDWDLTRGDPTVLCPHGWLGHSVKTLIGWCQQEWHLCTKDIGWVSVFPEIDGWMSMSQRPDSGKSCILCVSVWEGKTEAPRSTSTSSHSTSLPENSLTADGRLFIQGEAMGQSAEGGRGGDVMLSRLADSASISLTHRSGISNRVS